MEPQVFDFSDIHFLMVALDQYIQEENKKDKEHRMYGEATTALLERLTEMWKMQANFLVIPIDKSEQFGQPEPEIVAYAIDHDIRLNLQSKIVQRTLRLRNEVNE
jgi:hypothetical protein